MTTAHPESAEIAEAQRAALAAVALAEADAARSYARRMRAVAEIGLLWEPGPEAFPMIELAGTARIGQVRASTQLSDARRLVEVFPATMALLDRGVLYVPTAELLLSTTRQCTDAVQAEVERRLLDRITGLNTTDARRLLEATIPEVEADLDPALTAERLERARRDRRIWVQQLPDAMCHITALLDVIRGRRWTLDFEELVRAQRIADRRAGVTRTLDQTRADVFAELPGRLIALITAIQRGQINDLLALAQADPHAAEDVEALAAATADLTGAACDAPAEAPDELPDELPGEVPGESPEDLPEPVSPDDAREPLAPEDLPEPFPLPVWSPLPDAPPRSASEHHPGHPPDPPPAPQPSPPPGPPPGPPPDPATSPLTVEELTVELLRLPVRDPQVLNVHIPMTTLLDVDHRSGHLEGVGPVPAEHCRLMAPVAALRRIFVDHTTGVPVGMDRLARPTPEPVPQQASAAQVRERLLALLGPVSVVDRAESRHDPSSALATFVEVRDQRCTGIGCSQPARACHLDHETRYPDGPTAAWNLSAKSARCHRAKHAGWTVTRHPDGSTGWTSPLGHTYTSAGVWQAPPPLPDDLALPPPRRVGIDDLEHWPQEHPLWEGDDLPF